MVMAIEQKLEHVDRTNTVWEAWLGDKVSSPPYRIEVYFGENRPNLEVAGTTLGELLGG